MRIKSRVLYSQKQTCISSCGNPKPSFQTRLWTDFSHSSSTRSSTWLPTRILSIFSRIFLIEIAWELNSRAFFQSFLSSRKQTCINCETQNPHSTLNCGRISVTQVAQETQRGYVPEFHLSSCDNFLPKKMHENKVQSFLFAETNLHQQLWKP